MDSGLKQRLIGAGVLVALMVVFLPMLVKDPAPDSGVSDLPFKSPAAPGAESQSMAVAFGNQVAAPQMMGEGRGSPSMSHAEMAEQALPPAAANGVYVVHFAAFASAKDAELTVNQLKAYNLPAFAENFILSGRPAIRVRVGPYPTQAEAEIARVQAAQVRADVQPRVFMLIDQTAAAKRTVAALERQEQAKVADSGPAAAPTVGFVVQLGAFGNGAKATSLQDSLRKAGVAAFTDTINTSNGTLTRVNAGPVSSRVEADQLKGKVKSIVGVDGVVRSHP